jgi:bifunctional enzyme CysN/CysC
MSLGNESVTYKESHTSILRFSTAGSVDDGKSTLIGRLLHDSGNVYEDHLAALEASAKKSGSTRVSLALLTDGLKAEREQGITIDVAYRYFSTPRRRFILADSPGHVQYTRNMATGASTVDLTIILVDARAGIVEQTKRHAFITALLGVPRVVIAINKMDLVDYSQDRFDEIVSEFTEFSAKLGIREVKFIPISALEGDNVVAHSSRMSWYGGETVLEHLENVYIAGDQNLVDFRFPVQGVLNPDQNFRGYSGTISSGVIRKGEEVLALPAMTRSRVKAIVRAGRGLAHEELSETSCREAVVIQLEDQLDVSRGDMLVRSKNVPRITTTFEAMVVWLDDTPMDQASRYIIRHTTREAKGIISGVEYKIDIHTLGRMAPAPLAMNEIGRLTFTTTTPLFLDPYQKNRATGNFIVIDPLTFRTVAAGMVIDRGRHDEASEGEDSQTASHLHREDALVTPEEREARAGRRAVTIWMTGLSGSGKSTIAKNVERALFNAGVQVFYLDGDNLRHGLNRGLGFSREDRSENLRRAAEVAALFNQAGVSVLCAFISPYEADRKTAREIIGEARFVEVHVTAPLAVCEGRDPHGLYQKARRGELTNFTGVSDPYEPPKSPALTVDTSALSLEECVGAVVNLSLSRSSTRT